MRVYGIAARIDLSIGHKLLNLISIVNTTYKQKKRHEYTPQGSYILFDVFERVKRPSMNRQEIYYGGTIDHCPRLTDDPQIN